MFQKPVDEQAHHRALVEAYREFLNDLMTEPLTMSELADVFGLSRAYAKTFIESLPGVERHNSLWRVPVKSMPASWAVEKLFRQDCHNL